jgi:tRNA A-37 threonylcarbamoyl transferase component Bud32
MTLEQHVKELLSHYHKNRAFSTIYNGEKVWVKLPAMGEANFWHIVLKLFFKITKNPLFAPTVVTNPKESLKYEAQKLQQLANTGINVPKVLAQSDDFIVLSDCGTPLSLLINSDKISFIEKKEILGQLSTTLANMHNIGIYHSRPALRDITYKEGQVYFMDFEENLENILSQKDAITRDGLIYIHSIYRKVRNQDLVSHALSTYIKNLKKDLLINLQSEVKKYKFLHLLLENIEKFAGKDAKALLHTINFITNYH